MKAFYVSRLSEHISQTPEGYLVCTNVPIGRTGWQDYAPRELELDGDSAVHVWRDAAEVFSEATVASFEGKTVTDGHPPIFVSPSNENAYHRGHAQHIRRGTGDGGGEVLLADLVIKDAILISKIQAGLREISCGYDCEYVQQADGSYTQKMIRGNHIAVVPNGRAGDKICIRDSADESEERRQHPVLNLTRHIFGLGIKAYAKDAEPEAVATAIDDFNAKAVAQTKARNQDEDPDKKDDDKDKAKDEKKKDGKAMTDAETRMNLMCDRMDTFLKRYANDKDKDTITTDEEDEANEETEDAKDPNEEEEEEAKDADLVPVPTLPSSALPCNPIPGADSFRKTLLALKPVIARSGDKKAIDTFNKTMRSLRPAGGKTKDGYKRLLNRKAPDNVVQAYDQAKDQADFFSNVSAYHRRNINEVAQERKLQQTKARVQ